MNLRIGTYVGYNNNILIATTDAQLPSIDAQLPPADA